MKKTLKNQILLLRTSKNQLLLLRNRTRNLS